MNSYMCIFSGNPEMTLKYVFEIDSSEITYIMKYYRQRSVISEELFVDDRNVLNREGSNAVVSINDVVTYSDIPQDGLFIRDIYFNTRFRGNEKLIKWFQFLSNSICIDLYMGDVTIYKPMNISLIAYMNEHGTEKINSFLNEYNFQQTIEFDKKSRGNRISIEADEKIIFFKRRGIDEPIPYDFESMGNRNLMQLLPSVFHCVENGGMLILDEFSSGFHNELEQLIIRFFMKKADQGQLIFVSHSTNLLSTSLLRPDQIYSVEFDLEGSKVKRFSSEKPREAQNLEKMYLGGVFGGIPKYENSYK